MSPVFFSENVIATTMKFTWMIHTSFAIMALFFHGIFGVFNTPLPALSETLLLEAILPYRPS
jgi:hypothetical protein